MTSEKTRLIQVPVCIVAGLKIFTPEYTPMPFGAYINKLYEYNYIINKQMNDKNKHQCILTSYSRRRASQQIPGIHSAPQLITCHVHLQYLRPALGRCSGTWLARMSGHHREQRCARLIINNSEWLGGKRFH